MDWTAKFDETMRSYSIEIGKRQLTPDVSMPEFSMHGGWEIKGNYPGREEGEFGFCLNPYDPCAMPVIKDLFPSAVFDSANDKYVYVDSIDFALIKLAAK